MLSQAAFRQMILVTGVMAALVAGAPQTEARSIAPQNGYGTFDPQSAWFTASATRRTIPWCYELSPDFAVQDSARIEAAVEQAFATWRAYIARKQPSLAAPFDLYPEFGGTCGGGMDLVFLLGGEAAQFVPADGRQPREDSPVFSVRTDFDFEAQWSRGFIWIHPGKPYRFSRYTGGQVVNYSLNWSDEYALETIILHEVGHLFGNGEISDTIMDQRYLDDPYLNSAEPTLRLAPTIDGRRELLPLALSTQRNQRTLHGFVNRTILDRIIGTTAAPAGIWQEARLDLVLKPEGSETVQTIVVRNAEGIDPFRLELVLPLSNISVVESKPVLKRCFLAGSEPACTPTAQHQISFGIASRQAPEGGSSDSVLVLYNMEPRNSQARMPEYERPSFFALEWIDPQGQRHLLARTIKPRHCGRPGAPGDGCERAD